LGRNSRIVCWRWAWTLVALACLTPSAWAQSLPAHPAPVPIMEFERGVDLVYGPPGCLGWGSMSLASAQTLFEVAEEVDGSFYIAASGFSGLQDQSRLLVPEVATHDSLLVAEVLEAGPEMKRIVLEPDFPVLMTPYDLVFQYPYEGHTDWLEVLSRARSVGVDVSSAGTRRVSTQLVRFTLPSGAQVLSIELPGASAELGSITSMSRVFAGRGELLTQDDALDVYVLARALNRGPRTRSVLANMASQRPPLERSGTAETLGPEPLLVFPGGVIPEHVTAQERSLCAEATGGLSPAAVVPHSGELSLGPLGLSALAAAHDLPYLAANLVAVGPEAPAPGFRSFLVEERDGLKIAVIGLVGPDMLNGLPVNVRSQWKLLDPLIAFGAARRAVDEREGRRPDLTVILVATEDGATLKRLEHATGADVVLGNFSARTQMGRREHYEVISKRQGREGVRFAPPLAPIAGTRFGVGRVSARFGPSQIQGRARLSAIVHENRPTEYEGPIDAAYAQRRRTLEERLIAKWNQVLLPDVAPIVERHTELQDLVFGDAVLTHGVVRPYRRSVPASFTDRLWMRLVTNVLKEQLHADVALSRNLPRTSGIMGPLQRFFIERWLRHPDAVQLIHMGGAELQALSARLAIQAGDLLNPDRTFSAGLDPSASRVGGRPIDPKQTYRVVVTDQVVSTSDLGPLLAGRETSGLFRAAPAGGWIAHPKGAALTIKDVVGGLFESWLDPQSASFDPRNRPSLEALLLDHSDRQLAQWHLQVDELSVRGSSLGNTSNVGTFAPSKETRVNTPEHLSIGFKTAFGVQYDGPDVLWDNRVAAQLQRQEFSAQGQTTTVQEAADDLVLSSELRFNSVKIDLGEHDIPMVPYVQASYDTEFTAIESPTDDDPNATLPHQHVVRAALGQIMTPNGWLKEVRLGALFQEDFSERPFRYDLGLVTGAKVELPLLGPASLKSQLDVRYLFPNENDTQSDLGLVVTSVSQIVIPVTSGMNLLVFADYYLVQGKLDSNSALGGSQVYGLGLDFARYFRL
jgi:hypothetical protein